MVGIGAVDGVDLHDDLTVRAPRQQRTREQWDRVLDAGLEIVEQGGYEAFTIAAICERAAVPPRALYARAATKDALFLAVYERGMSRVRAAEEVLDDAERRDLDHDQRVERAVRGVVRLFSDQAAFLRSVVLVSGGHPEVRRRGEAYRRDLGERFAAALTPPGEEAAWGRLAEERAFCFAVVFSTVVVRTAYGPGFGPTGDADALATELVELARRYLSAGAGPRH